MHVCCGRVCARVPVCVHITQCYCAISHRAGVVHLIWSSELLLAGTQRAQPESCLTAVLCCGAKPASQKRKDKHRKLQTAHAFSIKSFSGNSGKVKFRIYFSMLSKRQLLCFGLFLVSCFGFSSNMIIIW